ncbi:Glutathione S-transferase 1:-like isoform C, partial [Dinothrombium tinctorium]
MTIDFYYMIESPPCRAVLMTAKHLQISLNLKSLNLAKGEHLSDQFREINPQHCVPTIVDNGFVLWESRAIMRYLIEKYASNSDLYPQDLERRAKINQLLDFDIGTLYKNQSNFLNPILELMPTKKSDEEKFRKSLSILDTILSKQKFVASDALSIADLSIIASLSYAESAEFDFTEFTHVKNWMTMLKTTLSYYDEVNSEAIKSFTSYLKMKKQEIKEKMEL